MNVIISLINLVSARFQRLHFLAHISSMMHVRFVSFMSLARIDDRQEENSGTKQPICFYLEHTSHNLQLTMHTHMT